jgi:uncharacterized delta-60 repeat protein
MSYIIKQNEPLVNLKLTDTGRKNLSSGKLTFTSFSLGDGEMDYSSDTPSLVNILRPVDKQHDIQYKVPSEGTTFIQPLTLITSVPNEVFSSATERGFFVYDTLNSVDNTLFLVGNLTGTTTVVSNQLSVRFNANSVKNNYDNKIKPGDFLFLKIKTSGFTQNYTQVNVDEITTEPIPYLMYSILSINNTTTPLDLTGITTGTTFTIELDRDLPNYNSYVVDAFIYPGRETIKDYYDNPTPVAYWNGGLLDFTTNCTLSNDDVPVWNMSIVTIEDFIGLDSSFYKGKYNANSKNYWGTAINYDYFLDNLLNKVGLIHYTNNSISNFYGEGFYKNTFKLKIPYLMWHKKQFGGTSLGDNIGYTFVCDDEIKYIGVNNDIKYFDLIDQETIPTVVGKVLVDQKIVIIEHPELLAALSIKSNRNWTLPKPKLTLVEPGICAGANLAGVLASDEAIHITYLFQDTNGITGLHCEDYATIENTTTTVKDVVFEFPRDSNNPLYSELSYLKDYLDTTGTGFKTNSITLLWQKTGVNNKPNPSEWSILDVNGFIDTNGCINNVISNCDDFELHTESTIYPSNFLLSGGTSGAIDNTFNIGTGFTNGSNVYTIVSQPDNKILVGGDFTSYNGVTFNRIIRLNTNGTIDNTFNIGTGFNALNDYVRSIVQQPDGKILVGGAFGAYSGVTRNAIIRLNSNGTIDNTFNIGNGFGGGSVQSIALQPDGKILVGGFFTTYSGVTSNFIIRLNTGGTIDNTFNIGSGFGGSSVDTIALQPDGKILAGGTFTSYSGVTSNNIIRLNTGGTIDNTFNIGGGFDFGLNTITLQPDGKILVGGAFGTYSGVTSNRIIRLNTNGTIDNTFNIGTGFNIGVFSIVQQPDEKILVGGNFTTYSGVTSNRIIRLNTGGTIDNTFNIGTGFTGTSPIVFSIALQANGKILAGGNFTSYNNISRNSIVRLNPNATVDSTIYGLTRNQIGDVIISLNGLILKEATSEANLGVDGDYFIFPLTTISTINNTAYVKFSNTLLTSGALVQFNYLVGDSIQATTVRENITIPLTGITNSYTYLDGVYLIGSTTALTLTKQPNNDVVYVFYNGQLISSNNYSVFPTGTTANRRVELGFTPTNGSSISVFYLDNSSLGNTPLLRIFKSSSVQNLRVNINNDLINLSVNEKYNLNDFISLPNITNINEHTFGDETFFFGNIETDIKATIYKTLLTLNILPNKFISTSNPTFNPNQDKVAFTEMGIYDEDSDLVAIGKFSQPLTRKYNSDMLIIQATIDF